MSRLITLKKNMIDAGVSAELSRSDVRYVRFLNVTLLTFTLAQAPILSLLIALQLYTQLLINLTALTLCGLGFVLNRQGRHLPAKVLVVMVMVINSAYFAALFGSSAPTHLWLIPGAVLSALVFKPSEWAWGATIALFSLTGFAIFELIHPEMTPVIRAFSNPQDELQAAHGSTISAMSLTLLLVGMMHTRFVRSERALSKEKEQSEQLLRAILPDQIAQELRETGSTRAVRHEDVSLLFADIVGFTPLAASMPAEEVVAMLAEIFERVDELIARCGVEKIKTIGDAYMIAGGVPVATPDHATRLGRCALGMLEIIKQFSEESGYPLQMRVGLHRGPAVAGVIGATKFAYDLWGESVNLASRLESSGEPDRVQVSEDFYLKASGEMSFERRGEVTLKGVGPTQTYWLTGVQGHPAS